MKKLEAAIRDAESAKSDEHASQREQIRINVLLEKLHREHSWQGIQRWEAHFYTKALHEAADDARQSLFELAKEALQEAIYWANKYPNNKDIERAKEKAEKELKNPKTTHERIDQVKDELISAIREEEKIHLAEDIRKELKSLEEAILVAEKYPESDGIKEALKEAKKVRDAVKEGEVSPETKKEISEAKDKLIRELAYALAPADKYDVNALEEKLEEARTYRAKASRAPIIEKMLDDAMKNGYGVLSDSSKKDVKYNYTEAIKRIDDVIQVIQNLPDLELVKKLEALIEEAETLRANKDLSFVSKAKLYEALSEANYVKADHLSTDEDYILAYNKLEVAISSVEEANPDLPATDRDRELLKKAIEAAEEMLKREGLSKKDGEILNAEIAKGEAMLEKEGAMKVEMQRTTESIYAAVDNAKAANHLPATQEQIDRLNELLKEANTQRERPGISFEDLKTLDYAIEKGQQLIDHEAPKRAEYDEAIKVLEEALEQTAPMNPIEDPSKLATAEDKYLLKAKMRELSGQRIHVVASEVERIDRANRDANTVLLDPRATKSQVKKQIDYLDKMLQSLEKKATPEQIQEMRDLAKRAAIQLKRLNPVEAKKLNDEYQMMKTLLEGYDAKQLDISEKTANERIYKLQTALNDTIKQATDEEKEKLKDKIKELERDKENLSPEDKKELEDLLEKGKELADDLLANDIDVEDMMNQLEKWKEKTKLATSKQELKKVLERAQSQLDNNKELNTNRLKNAIQAGQKAYENEKANQATVDRAIQDLKDALAELEQQIGEKQEADKEKGVLEVLIKQAELKLKENISKGSRGKLESAITYGKNVLQDPTISADVVKEANQKLKDAIDAAELLVSEGTKRELFDTVQKAERLSKEGLYTQSQKNELSTWAKQAGTVYSSDELLESQARAEIEKFNAIFAQLIELASDFDYNQLRNKNNSLKAIRELFEDDTFDAKELDKVLNATQQLLETQKHPDRRAPKTEVQEKTQEIETLLTKYKGIEQEHWNEEKERLKKYIAYMDYMVSGKEWKPEGSNIELPQFEFQTEEDKNSIIKHLENSEALRNKAISIEEVPLKELINHNANLRKAIESIDKMTEEDKVKLTKKVEDSNASLSNVEDEELYNALQKLIEEAKGYLKEANGSDDTFIWPGMNRFTFIELMSELDAMILKVSSK